MTDSTHPQLPLTLICKPNTSFSSFVADDNEQLIHRIRQSVSGENAAWLYLWGINETGRSHLLQAACQLAQELGRGAFYLDPGQVEQSPELILEDLDEFDVVAIDDVPLLLGNRKVEEALFHLYNRLRDQGKLLLIAADRPPRHLQAEIADLVSRFSHMEIYQASSLSDQGKIKLLQLWSEQRGFSISHEVCSFILSRADRTISSLVRIIDALDRQSLQEKRLITVPFVKKVMGC